MKWIVFILREILLFPIYCMCWLLVGVLSARCTPIERMIEDYREVKVKKGKE